MKIAHIIPHSIIFPLASHNGRYEWVHQLAALQVKQGHDVTIYGGAEGTMDGISLMKIPVASDDKKHNNVETFRFAFSHDHDIYHSHFDTLHYDVASETNRPIVFTQHWWPKDVLLEKVRTKKYSNVWAVPPTEYMHTYDIASHIATKGYIHHGINLEHFHPSSDRKNGRLLFVGRISPEKRIEAAIAIAKKANIGLDIAGKVSSKNKAYWETLQPLIDGASIRYLGALTSDEIVTVYTKAAGLLCTFAETEAFGLVTIEAQACGTPVLTLANGAQSELIRDGVTGFLCNSEDDFVRAIQKLPSLSCRDCLDFAKQFDIHRMAALYEKLYKELI